MNDLHAIVSSPPVAHEIYSWFACVLDYPGAELFVQAQRIIMYLSAPNPEAAELVRKSTTEWQEMTMGQLQELYTGTFDMRPDRTTNLGCHLFGDDIRRNLFMAQLKERMEAKRVQMGSELPDHLGLILELLAREDSEEESQTLVTDCLRPALTRLLSTFGGDVRTHPYARILQALLASLPGNPVAS